MATVNLKVNSGFGKHHVNLGLATLAYRAGEVFQGSDQLLKEYPGKFTVTEEPVTKKELPVNAAADVEAPKATPNKQPVTKS